MLLYAVWGLPARRTIYDPISPVKNMTSVARKSHIATFPGETGAAWVGTGAQCPAGVGWALLGAAIAIVGSTLRDYTKGIRAAEPAGPALVKPGD